jgi:hypothetical protein
MRSMPPPVGYRTFRDPATPRPTGLISDIRLDQVACVLEEPTSQQAEKRTHPPARLA